MKRLAALAVVIVLLVPGFAFAGAPAEQLQKTIDQLFAVLKDPRFKGEDKHSARREKIKQVIYQRFDFAETAMRSLGPEWRRHSPEEQKEFVRLFTNLLEDAYLNNIDAYNGERVQYLSEREENNYAEVNTKMSNNKGQESSVNYRLHNVNGDWKVYDVVIEDISVVNNYRSQFSRVLAKSSYSDLIDTMTKKAFAPAKEKVVQK